MTKATYLFITLLLVVGTQIASSKSVSEVVKDTARLVKRQSEDKEEVTTEQSTILLAEDLTTTIVPDIEENDATVKPLAEDKIDKKDDEKKNKQMKNPKKPIISELLNRGGEPSTNLLPPLPFTCIPPSYYGQSPPLPQYPPAFAQSAPGTHSFIPPPSLNPQYNIPTGSSGYDYPIPSGPAFSAGGFASASASASADGQGGSVSTSTSPGGAVHTSFGIGTRGSFSDSGSPGPFSANGGRVSQSATSHSSSGPNGQESSSSFSNSGPNGIRNSYSHSGPNGVQHETYGVPYPISNRGPNGIQTSYSHSGNNGAVVPNGGLFPNVHNSGSFVSASGTIPPGGQPSFISIRGSFPGSDDESVAIEVDGPEGTRVSAPEGAHISGSIGGKPAGAPQYPGPNYAYSGPGYASSGAFAPAYYSGPTYMPYAANGVDINAIFQEYFAQLQAQQEAFQRQIQQQIAAQQQAGGTFASGGAFMTNDYGNVDPNAQLYVNTVSLPNFASAATSLDSRFGVGGTKSSAYAFPFSNKSAKDRIWDQSNQVDSNFGYPNGPASAFSSINLGPQGGYQQGAINPARTGTLSRFGEGVPAPSGNNYGVFSSSSSSSSTGPDGKTVSHKSATVGVNDNGKVSVKTIHDP
ncbi:uncharacterized protein LOC131668811 isoform X1 [Phymastichus coffea]|uniref:uncharacterized protein LOC131668811 isoform X1 n=1 Tax=Phymastichus coffea TaxID=108790 RepID=UPI00273CCF37|nr:uncharacterized protein LOC131668811 isoform X1 [Phymastichus coffea]